MMSHNRIKGRRGFTLVELMVAIGIIALLVAILLPAARAVRVGAKKASSQATFNAISAGLEAYKGEQKVGGSYPPSASDNTANYGMIQDPFAPGAAQDIMACGANLLTFALQGADFLGTAGFIDLPDAAGVRDGLWWNDVNANYKVGTNTPGVPDRPRYGPYADGTLQEKSGTLSQLVEKGIITDRLYSEATASQNLPFYLDGFERPVLYFRARPSANFMVTNPGTAVGIFDQRDNCVMTGTNVSGGASPNAINFGGGFLTINSGQGHGITDTFFPDPNPLIPAGDLTTAQFNNSFEQFIWNRNVTQKNMPNRADSYLLIAPGEDGIYGNSDDITNWSRDQ